jgi:hypothetical protein
MRAFKMEIVFFGVNRYEYLEVSIETFSHFYFFKSGIF